MVLAESIEHRATVTITFDVAHALDVSLHDAHVVARVAVHRNLLRWIAWHLERLVRLVVIGVLARCIQVIVVLMPHGLKIRGATWAERWGQRIEVWAKIVTVLVFIHTFVLGVLATIAG